MCAFIVHTRGIKINCDFSYIENCVRNCYQCTVQKLIITKQNQTVTAINGLHLNPDDSNGNAVSLKIIEQVVAFIPSELHQHFPYLSILKIWSSELRSISQEDIRYMKFLTDLSLSGNYLETLDSNLFQFNHRLIIIDFTRNRLKHIGANIFKPLKNIISVDFYQNYCINNGARYIFDALKDELKEKCQATSEMMVKELLSLSNEIDRLNRKMKERENRIKACQEEKDSHTRLDVLFPTILAKEFKWDEM